MPHVGGATRTRACFALLCARALTRRVPTALSALSADGVRAALRPLVARDAIRGAWQRACPVRAAVCPAAVLSWLPPASLVLDSACVLSYVLSRA